MGENLRKDGNICKAWQFCSVKINEKTKMGILKNKAERLTANTFMARGLVDLGSRLLGSRLVAAFM